MRYTGNIAGTSLVTITTTHTAKSPFTPLTHHTIHTAVPHMTIFRFDKVRTIITTMCWLNQDGPGSLTHTGNLTFFETTLAKRPRAPFIDHAVNGTMGESGIVLDSWWTRGTTTRSRAGHHTTTGDDLVTARWLRRAPRGPLTNLTINWTAISIAFSAVCEVRGAILIVWLMNQESHRALIVGFGISATARASTKLAPFRIDTRILWAWWRVLTDIGTEQSTAIRWTTRNSTTLFLLDNCVLAESNRIASTAETRRKFCWPKCAVHRATRTWRMARQFFSKLRAGNATLIWLL